MNEFIGPCLMLFSFLFSVSSLSAEIQKPDITVLATSSLTNVLQELGDGFTKDTAIPIKFSFAANSADAPQIENGAAADILFSADSEWLDSLQARNLIQQSSRHDVVGNRLVLIAPAATTIELAIAPNFPLAAALGKGRLATGDPDSVSLGRYARDALTSFGVWKDVSDRLARTDSARSALALVARGKAPFGIVYDTDARIEKKVRVVDVFPDRSHKPIVYSIALSTGAKSSAARFVAYIRGPAGDLAFKAYGFVPLR